MSVTTQQSRISDNARQALAAVKALNSRYGMNYLIDILRGQSKFGLRQESHATIQPYGSLESCSPDYLRRLIRLLISEEYLEVVDRRFGLIGITTKGDEYLDNPSILPVGPKAMNESSLDRELNRRLRELRSAFASKEAKPPFRIFTNFTLEELVAIKPTSLHALMEIPGLGPHRANQYGPAILACIRELADDPEAFYQELRVKKAASPSHQAVKIMFESGASVEQIAQKRQVKVATVEEALITLHRAGEIDLRPWIEQTVSEEELEQGTTWFLNSDSDRLRDAYEEIGLDYDVLKLCKLYVADIQSVEVRMAS